MLVSLLANLALAEDKPKPEVELGATIYTHYGYDLTDGSDGYNEFAVDRAYLYGKAKISKRLSARLTLDVGRFDALVDSTGTEYTLDTKYRAFLKHAYLEWKDWAPGMSVRAGMIDTPYVPYQEKFLGTRWIGKVFTDSQKVLGSADLGVNLAGEHAGGVVSWGAAVMNGEGYDKLEVNAGKSVQARLSVDPLAKKDKSKLPITAFVNYNGQGPDADAILTYVGALGYKMPYLTLWGEYVGRSQGDISGSGYSATLMPGMPKYGYLLVRYDHFDPDGATDKDANDAISAGLAHDFVDKVSLGAFYERGTDEATPDEPEHGLFVRLQAGF